MRLTRTFDNLRFPEGVIRGALEVIEALPDKQEPGKFLHLGSGSGSDDWTFNDAHDFFAEYPRSKTARLTYRAPLKEKSWYCELTYALYSDSSSVGVDAQTRTQINAVMNVFQQSLNQAVSIRSEREIKSTSPPAKVFIGHGRSKAWEELKNHLQDKHGYDVVAFESGARAGHHIRDILEEMLSQSSIAFLVLTGEDELADERMRARQNVIHETGLFQGRLGFSRGVVLLEEGVDQFSNLAGIQHIPFAKDHINGTFGEVLAVIKREFGS